MPALAFTRSLGAAAMGLAADHLRGRSRPFVVNHLVTVRCNLRCPFCYVSGPEQREFNRVHQPRSAEMSTAQMQELYRQLVAERFHIAVVLGGEPLLREDLGEILRVPAGLLFVTVFTNGFLLEERLELLAQATAVFVSLDAPDEAHDELRATPGAFRRAVAGLEALRRRLPGVRAAVNVTITAGNAARVPEMLAFARSFGVPIAFQPPTFDGQFEVEGRPHAASAGNAAPAEAVVDAFRAIRAAAEEGQAVIGTRAFFDLVIQRRQAYPCYYPALVLGPVYPNGDVIGCSQGRVLGNVRTTPVRELVASPTFHRNAATGQACARGCRDWGIHDLSAVYSRRFTLADARGYYRAFVH
ncbi:MAG: radical SAM protein [Myxococcales bacterium]